jgi:hypothetical protein
MLPPGRCVCGVGTRWSVLREVLAAATGIADQWLDAMGWTGAFACLDSEMGAARRNSEAGVRSRAEDSCFTKWIIGAATAAAFESFLPKSGYGFEQQAFAAP